MEAAIQTLVKVFLKSTKGKDSLGKSEFQGLVKGQLSNILTDTDSNAAINNMKQGLDADHDGKVGFEEYMKLVGYLAVSLSEQRQLAGSEEPAQNAASAQVDQSAVAKEEEKPEANAAAKEEAKPEAKVEAKVEAPAEVKVEANAEPMVEVKLDGDAGPKLELKAEGMTAPEVPKLEEVPAAAATVEAVAAAAEAAPTAVEVVVKEGEENVEKITDKVEEAVENVAAAVEEEVEKKTEEATS